MRRWLFCLFSAACTAEPLAVEIPFPPGPPSAVTEVLFVRQGDTTKTYAYAIGDFRGAPIGESAQELRLGDDATLEAALFDESLAHLGLVPGPIVPPPEREKLPYPRPSGAFVLKIDPEGRPGDWEASPAPFDALQSKLDAIGRPPGTGYCPKVNVSSRTIAGGDTVYFAVKADPGGALIGTSTGAIYLVRPDHPAPRPISTTRATGTLRSAFRDGSGTYWFGGRNGEIYRATLAGTVLDVQLVSDSPFSGDIYRIAGEERGGETEVFALDAGGGHGPGNLQRFHRGEWTKLETFQGTASGRGGLAYVGPGEVIVAWPFATSLRQVKDGQLSTVGVGSSEGLTAAGHLPGIGSLAGGATGEVFIKRSSRWEPLEGFGNAIDVAWFEAFYEGGFLVGGAIGLLEHRRPGGIPCASIDGVGHAARYIVAVSEREVLVAGDRLVARPGEPAYYTFLTVVLE